MTEKIDALIAKLRQERDEITGMLNMNAGALNVLEKLKAELTEKTDGSENT